MKVILNDFERESGISDWLVNLMELDINFLGGKCKREVDILKNTEIWRGTGNRQELRMTKDWKCRSNWKYITEAELFRDTEILRGTGNGQELEMNKLETHKKYKKYKRDRNFKGDEDFEMD